MIKEEKEKIISFNLEKVAIDQPAELFCYVVIFECEVLQNRFGLKFLINSAHLLHT